METGIIKIKPGFRNLIFNITYSSQLNVTKPNIRYKLLGYQREWQDGSNLEIRYYNLSPGTYQLEIQMTVDRNEWSPSIFSEKITIKPYWYESILFRIFIVLLVLALLYLLYRFRIYQLKKILQVRRKISSDLHDDIGSTLSSINMYSQIAKLKPNDPQYVDNIQQSAKEVLEKLDDIVWATNPKNDKLENLMARIENFAMPILNAKQIAFNFSYDEALNNTEIYEDIRQNIFLVCKEAINNIAKYANAKQCTLQINIKGKHLFCTITDDGVGFDTNQPTQRNGINNMQLRVSQIKGIFTIDSIINKGTSIKFKIPL